MVAGIKPPKSMTERPTCPVCGTVLTSSHEEKVDVVKRLCDPKDEEREPGVYRRYEPCGHVVVVGATEEEVAQFQHDHRCPVGCGPEHDRAMEIDADRQLAEAEAYPDGTPGLSTPRRRDGRKDDLMALARVLWLADGYVRPGYLLQAKAVAKALTSEPALAAFRKAWEQADAEGAKGDRVRRGMAAAIEAVS